MNPIRVLHISMVLALGFSKWASAASPDYCGSLSGLQKSYCLALKSVENTNRCDKLKGDTTALSLCNCLELLTSFTPSEQDILNTLMGQKTNQKMCQTIQVGILTEDCSEASFGESQNWCSFGKYIASEHPQLVAKAKDSNLKSALIPIIQTWVTTAGVGNPSEFSEKLLNIASRLKVKFFEQAPKRVSISIEEYVAFMGDLVRFIETHKSELISQAIQEKDGFRYFSYETRFGKDLAPCAIAVNERGRIIAFLKSVRIGTEKVALNHLGKGSFKNVSLAIDYQEAISSEIDGRSVSPLLAAGRIKLAKKNKVQLDSDAIWKSYESTQREMDLLQMVSTSTGVVEADSLIQHRSEHFQNFPRLTFIQKFYSSDMLGLFFSLFQKNNGNQPKYYRGRSFDRVKVDLAVQLLEGLSAIHAAGIHHRDIKPENIMIDYDQVGRPRAYITDFGLSAQLDWVLSGKQDSQAGGTLIYMAPQYLRSYLKGNDRQATLNIKNDVWAMGLTFYYLNNFWNWSPSVSGSSASPEDAIKNIFTYEDLSKIGISEFSTPPIFGTYEHVVYRMLHPDPVQRLTAQEALVEMKKVQELTEKLPDSEFYFKPENAKGRFVISEKMPNSLKKVFFSILSSAKR